MIKFKKPTLPINLYWPSIVTTYYNDIQPNQKESDTFSIWTWLERDYGAYQSRLIKGINVFQFDEEHLMTAFLLKFKNKYTN